MTYWHLYAGWLPPGSLDPGVRASMTQLVKSNERRVAVLLNTPDPRRDHPEMTLQLMATWDEEPDEDEEDAALPMSMRSRTTEDWG